MAITADELQLRLSGGASNTSATASIGGAISNTAVSATALHNIFDKVTGDESNVGDIEYRVLYIRNGNSSLTAENVKVYLSQNYDSGTQTVLGPGDVSIGVNEAAGATAQTLTNEGTQPSSVTFSQPTQRSNAIDVGNLTAGQSRALYLRREIAAGASAEDNASFEITIEADSAE